MSKGIKLNSSLVEVRKSENRGAGVFCTKDIKAGDLVLVSKPVKEFSKPTKYSIQIDWNKHILTDKPSRFVNHSCDPSVGLRFNKYGAYDLIALKDLSKGTEITFCYPTTEYAIIGFNKCLCGSKNCLKVITGWKDFPISRKKFFIEKGFIAPYLQKKL